MPAIIFAGASLDRKPHFRQGRGVSRRPARPGRRGRPDAPPIPSDPARDLAPAAPPITVIEFIRWSVSDATSNSRQGVCFSRSSSAIPCSTCCRTAKVASAHSSSSAGGESGPARRSSGMLPRYVELAPIVAQMKTHVRVTAAALILAGLATGCSRTTEGTVAMTTEPGPRTTSRPSSSPTIPGLPNIEIPNIPIPGIPARTSPMYRRLRMRRR